MRPSSPGCRRFGKAQSMQAGAFIELDNRVSSIQPQGFAPRSMDALADEDLLRLCAAEESRALQELVRRYQAPLYRFLARLMGSEEDAEEDDLNAVDADQDLALAGQRPERQQGIAGYERD